MSTNNNTYVAHYTPRYTLLEERDFLSYLDNLKYEGVMRNPDRFMKNVKIFNFDIIHCECCGTSLKNSYEYYQIVQENKFQKYTPEAKETTAGAGLRNQNKTQQPVYFEKRSL